MRPSIGQVIFKYGVPLAISVGLCWLLFRDIDIHEMWEIITTQCDFSWILLALAFSILSHVIRGARWGIQLRALDIRPGLFALTLSIFGTYAVNLVLPRLGELWRTGWIAQRQKAPFTTVFGSMVADRLADTVTVALITAATFVIARRQLTEYLSSNTAVYDSVIGLLSSPWLWSGLIIICAAVAFIFLRFPANPLIVKIKGVLRGLWEGFAVIASMKGKGRWLLLTVGLWGCYFLQLYLAFFAFPATAAVVERYGIVAPLVCFVLSSISMGVPSNGGIGPWQWAIIFGLGMFSAGIPELTESYATTFANLVMGCQTLLLILLGIFTFVCIAVMKRRQGSSSPQPLSSQNV
ncbi:MAG: flippase-like domain-containing protein [Pseudoflavonifractor sp.]|nr:flippase-like domain-containing protein [Alloprevotella sp.]MCM1116291.1 flippase-like domain-containing protein [Pseudoflavonifractor sp.]